MGKRAPIKNRLKAAKYTPLKWWCKTVKPSYTEAIINNTLKETGISFYREVCFAGLMAGKSGYYRFDFWIPCYNLVIEYDGEHHLEQKQQMKDEIKDRFIKKHGLRVYRIDKTHFHTLKERVLQILNEVKIDSKRKATYIKPYEK